MEQEALVREGYMDICIDRIYVEEFVWAVSSSAIGGGRNGMEDSRCWGATTTNQKKQNPYRRVHYAIYR